MRWTRWMLTGLMALGAVAVLDVGSVTAEAAPSVSSFAGTYVGGDPEGWNLSWAVTITDAGRITTATERHPEAWAAAVEGCGHGIVESAGLTPEEEADEFLLMGLRLREGIDPARYAALAGRALDERRIGDLMGEGLIARRIGARLAVTAAGFPVLDAVVADLAA